jgi:hypothetical protein
VSSSHPRTICILVGVLSAWSLDPDRFSRQVMGSSSPVGAVGDMDREGHSVGLESVLDRVEKDTDQVVDEGIYLGCY